MSRPKSWSKALGGVQESTGTVRKNWGMMSEMSVGAGKAAGLMRGDIVKVCVLWG